MKRRNFIQTTSLAGTAGFITTLGTPVSRAQNTARKPSDPNRILRLKGEYYRHYPIDFTQGTEGALGFKGWGESVDIAVPAEETALIPMHIWNIGLSPELPFTSEGPAGGVMDMLEWASRSAPIIETVIPPVLSAARKAGIAVVHVASDERYAKKYPGFNRAVGLAGAEPRGLSKAPGADTPKPPDDRKIELLFGKRFTESEPYYSAHMDFPDQAKPLDSEYVVTTAHQLTEVLRGMGVWNLVYIGFAINWCLWFSPGGMLDMSRLGYRCSCIREAVTAVENKESTRGEFNKQQAMWRTSLMFGYIHGKDDFIGACGKLGEKKS
ncbi:hypothetical protein LLG96_03540 [bacterium]|nr:hypothetical protein [bacterium]